MGVGVIAAKKGGDVLEITPKKNYLVQNLGITTAF
jgi:hypothetical protein